MVLDPTGQLLLGCSIFHQSPECQQPSASLSHQLFPIIPDNNRNVKATEQNLTTDSKISMLKIISVLRNKPYKGQF